MKKTAIFLIFLASCIMANAETSEFFDNLDENAVKAGISKYILSRGGNISHGDSYSSNTIQATEILQTTKGRYQYNYIFKIIPKEKGTELDMVVLKSGYGISPVNIDIQKEQKIMESIKASIKGRFLYGLGFEYAIYNENGKIYKAPKGRNKGIVLTAVKYDALKKGLMTGDIIIEVNGTPLNEIPIEKYTNILNAKSLTDELTLTCLRGNKKFNVILIPRLSNTRIF